MDSQRASGENTYVLGSDERELARLVRDTAMLDLKTPERP